MAFTHGIHMPFEKVPSLHFGAKIQDGQTSKSYFPASIDFFPLIFTRYSILMFWKIDEIDRDNQLFSLLQKKKKTRRHTH